MSLWSEAVDEAVWHNRTPRATLRVKTSGPSNVGELAGPIGTPRQALPPGLGSTLATESGNAQPTSDLGLLERCVGNNSL